MVKWNIQAIIYNATHRQLTIGQYEPNKATLELNSEDKSLDVPVPLVITVVLL